MNYTKDDILKLVNEATSALENRINVDVLNKKRDVFKKFQVLAMTEAASHFMYGYVVAKLEEESK